MKKITITSTFLFLLGTMYVSAGTFNSLATGNWNDPTKWSFVGDVDGIPDSDDDVTINGHIITVNVASLACRDITVVVGGTLDLQRGLLIYGHYIQNGIESGSATGGIYFLGTAKNISGSGTINNNCQYIFSTGGSRTILAGTTIVKTVPTTVYSNITVTNLGSLTVTSVVKASAAVTNYTFINSTNAILTLRFRNFFAGGNFFCSASGNTVNINYAFDPLPLPNAGTYFNLRIISPATTFSANIIVTNDFTILATGGINSNNFNLSIAGHFTRAGVWTPSLGFNVTMNGTISQNITNSATTVMQFQGLVIANPTSVVLNSGTYQVLNNLTINQGTFNANSRPVTFISTASTTAVIGTVGATGSITNASAMTFERFIDARAAGYSDMAGDMIGKTIADWDGELLLTYTYNPPMAYPSIYGYDETLWDYVPITSSAQALAPGVGYEVYLDSDGNQISFNATTMTSTGFPYIGSADLSSYVTFNNDGWNLVGNPYHANLSWDAMLATTSGIASDIMFYDEVTAGFVTVAGGSGALIAPGQGFWVNVTNAIHTFNFTEAVKSTSTSSTFRNKTEEDFSLRLKSIGQTTFTCGTAFRFSTTPEHEIKGSLPFKKLPSPEAPILYSKSIAGKDLKINLLNSNENTLIIPLKFSVGLSGIYAIEAQNSETANAEGYNCVNLYDNKLKRTIDISSENYQFYAEKGEGENRFTLTLSKTGDCQKSIDAVSNTNNVDINRIGDNTVVKLNFETETSVSITITDLLGQTITPSQLLIATTQDVYLPLPSDFSGIYMVNVTYNNKIQSRKLFK